MASSADLSQWYSSLSSDVRNHTSLSQVICFVSLAVRIKDDIMLAQASTHPPHEAPPILPQSVQSFLADSCGGLPLFVVPNLWLSVRDTVWNQCKFLNEAQSQIDMFVTHGLKTGRGMAYRSLYPPYQYCPKEGCPRTAGGMRFTRAQQREVVLFTLADGVLPAWSVHLECESCATNFHHNFSVQGAERTYYAGIPDILQVGEHQFAEVRLINSWISLMVTAWVSASNCARFYNLSLSQSHGRDLIEETNWTFKGEVTYQHVYDGFTALALLEDALAHDYSVCVPHSGLAAERFKDAVVILNDKRRITHPEVYHLCDLCTRMWNEAAGKRIKVVVTDGVTVGRPCCRHFNCKDNLLNNKDRFCKRHSNEKYDCCIKGCSQRVTEGHKTCTTPAHRASEAAYLEQGTARFQLVKLMEKARVSQPEDSMDTNPSTEEVDADLETEFSIQTDGTGGVKAIPVASGNTENKEFLKRVYRMAGIPDHVFYDNNCSLAKSAQNDPAFQDVRLTVDVFHFKSKHATTDVFFQTHCNPAFFPELKGEGDKAWYFNSSIAEQTNVWFGGYQSMCREMHADRYNFVLDEMIARRNRMTLEKLEREGRNPTYSPVP
ncbi:hypothetical protein BKA70DRAFT_1435986 [Coprinopsis sp. MPI-PUGE-AT-0042]|nr:hypothetical protein BKA70DRAFT_1435986 [Coprinopsis sp. MPI-PUGE-AT-0042]